MGNQKAGKDFQEDAISPSSRAVRIGPQGSHGLLVTPQESCGVNGQHSSCAWHSPAAWGMSTGEGQGHRGAEG